jgi:hypothetical protein
MIDGLMWAKKKTCHGKLYFRTNNDMQHANSLRGWKTINLSFLNILSFLFEMGSTAGTANQP